MADFSLYLFWTGLVAAFMSVGIYAAYVLSATVSLRRFSAVTEAGTVTVSGATGRPNPGLGRLATSFTSFTFIALTGAVATRWSAAGYFPMANLYEFTLSFSMGVSGAYLAFETVTRQRRIGIVAMPIVAIMLGIAALFPSDIKPLVPALQNARLLTIHVSVMMISYAVLTVAFCGAFVYLLQGGEGRRRFASLPSADAAGDLAHKAVIVGFPMLAIGIALGAWWANTAWGRYWGWDPKETSALVTWLSIAAYFHASAGTGTVANAPGIRRVIPVGIRRGWRPDPMWWLVVMYVLVLFTYFAVNLWIKGLHSYAGV
ncbi:MAG: cytochrome c biogenesis protein CcsA [Chloroflexi bacterium]|nr:cytochrome c biogenesis protein CcsA [Chloroflexota bacterium]